jgi:hypothetical protein
VRITQIEIKDFRGFPGPGTYTFDLDGGKNLLIYGENGSGKSSLFHALVEFFNLDSLAKPFADYKNVFSDSTLQDGCIMVHFDDSQPPGELLSRVVYGGSGGVLFHPNAILENGAVHDLR